MNSGAATRIESIFSDTRCFRATDISVRLIREILRLVIWTIWHLTCRESFCVGIVRKRATRVRRQGKIERKRITPQSGLALMFNCNAIQPYYYDFK